MNEHRIHGPPGTGKTTTLAHWVGKAAERFGNDAVLVSSFTRAAAVEIASRGLTVDRDNVGTLHAICYRALGRPKIAEDSIGEWNAYAPEYQLSRGSGGAKVAEDAGAFIPEQATEGDELHMASQTLRAKMADEDRWPERTRAFYSRWKEWKREAGVMDFTDLIEVGRETLARAPGNIAVGFFDEAQDLSPLELSLARQWAAAMEYVVLVGDADQCIYTFKGSTPRAFLEPEIPPENNRVLAQSHRVPRAVHGRAKALIEQCSYRYPTEYLPRDAEGGVSHSGSSSRHCIQLADEVEEEPPFGSVMILASCAFMLQGVVRELRARGVPFHNPYRKTNGAWNPMRGGVERIKALLAPRQPQPDGKERLWTWGELQQFVEPLAAKGVVLRGGKENVAAYAKERRTEKQTVTRTDLRGIFEPEALEALLTAREDADLLKWLDRRLLGSQREKFDYAFNVARRNGTHILFREPSVVVGTIHSVKGAQADTVFLMPDLSAQGFEEWRKTGDGRDSVLRLFYVGMTRARESLVLCSPSGPLAADLA